MDVPVELLSKLERYCAFQERCEFDIRKKLTSMPCSVAQRDEIIRRLKEHDFLNEQRYVETFVRSKLHEQWGKLKIRQALYVKNIAPSLIDENMNSMDEDAYAQMIAEVVEKWKKLHSADVGNRPKLFRYMLTRGFTIQEVMSVIEDK